MDNLKVDDHGTEAVTEKITRSKSSPAVFSEPIGDKHRSSTQDENKQDNCKPSTPDFSQILEKDWTTSLNASLDSAEWNCDTLIGDISTTSSSYTLSNSRTSISKSSSSSSISSSSSDDTTILLSSSTETVCLSEEDNEISKPALKKLKK